MTKSKSQLKTLLTKWALSNSPYRNHMLQMTRDYIASTSITQLNTEIKLLKSQRLLTLLSGASLPLGCRKVFLEQSRKIHRLPSVVPNE